MTEKPMKFCFMTIDVLQIKTILVFDVARNHEHIGKV